MSNENQETKTCKYCQSEIPKKAKICPVCRKKQSGGSGIVIGVIVVIIFIGMFGGHSSQSTAINNNSNGTNSAEINVDANENSAASPVSSAEENAVSSDSFVYDDMSVKYLKHEIAKNSIDQTCLVVYYEFTNNSNSNEAFYTNFTSKVYQNGVELESTIFNINDETDNDTKEIMPGATVTIALPYKIGNDRSEVTLQVKPWFSDSKILLERKLVLQ